MAFNYHFSAVKGLQAGREYYIAMIPLGLLNKLFSNEEDYLLPEYRAQRNINEARIPKIKDYYEVLGERLSWDSYKEPLYDIEIIEELKKAVDEAGVPFELITKLVVMINSNLYCVNYLCLYH